MPAEWLKNTRGSNQTGKDEEERKMASWEDGVRRVVPYTPGEQPKDLHIVKLNTNENPYPPSPGVMAALSGVTEDSLRRYPDPAAAALTKTLADAYHVSPDQVFVGVGSDDVLAMSFLTFFNSGKPILFPDITYSFYEVWADLFRIPYQKQKLNADFEIDKNDYLKENGGIIFPNPNAPTGVLMEKGAVRDILRANPGSVVIVDEAYIDFAPEGSSALSLIPEFENLLVVQTFSKSRSMAGMRIGFAIGSEKLIHYLNDCKYSFNSYTMNQAALAAGKAAVEDSGWYRETARKVIATRERSKKELSALGFSFADSQTNFLFVRHEKAKARDLFQALRRAGIIVRYFDSPRIDDYLRITIGTDEQMDVLFDFLKSYL